MINLKQISDHLKNVLNQIPEQPGIYKMINSKGNIIYIGKSKCLKKRVKSYFSDVPKWEKVTKMVSFIHDIKYIVTDTHLEARLLECELIKFHQPVFNSQMKNDKRYVFLKIEDNMSYSPLSVVRDREENTFGPFRSSSTLTNTLESLRKIYPIQKVKQSYTFEHHIIPIKMEQETFLENRNYIKEILTKEKNLTRFIKTIEKKMKEAADNYRFETAIYYRDLIQGLNYIKHGINGYQDLISKNIILKIPVQDGFKLFWIQKGHILLKELCQELKNDDMESFLQRGQAISIAASAEDNMEEKRFMDFRDIIYSEIMNLPDDMIIQIM